MSKELNFQDGNDVLKYQDSNSALKLYLSEDGLPFDLSRFDSLTMKVGNENGYLLEKPVDLSSVTDPQSGNVTIPLDGDIMTKLIPGDYNVELWSEVNPIIYDAGANEVNISVSDTGLQESQAIFPSDGDLVITVDDNIKSSPFDSINAYPIDDIWASLQAWKTDTVNTLNTNITSGLQTEITQWQGDISEKLKNELLQDLATDEGNIRQELDSILTSSLDDLINKEINDLKTNVTSDIHNAMIADVANQIATIKPEITSDLHTNLTNELTNELSTTLQADLINWENSTDTDLNNKLAQAIVDKTTAMQNSLSTEFTNYIANQLGTYESSATNTITSNITAQVTQNIANEFNSEDSKVRTDLENLVASTIQNDVENTLQQMQQNGDIYATKQQFTDFTNVINADLQKLDLANDIGNQIATINTELQNLPNVENEVNSLVNNALQFKGNVSGTTLSSISSDGIYNLAGVSYSDGPYTTAINGVLVQTGTASGVQSQVIIESLGHVYYRMINSAGTEGWFTVANENDIAQLQSAVTSLTNKTLQYQGVISSFDSTNVPGYYKYSDGTISSTLVVSVYNDVLLQYRIDTWDANGLTFSADNDYAPKIRISTNNGSTWTAWKSIATGDDVANIKASIANLSSEVTMLQSSVASNASSIASNASSIASESSAIASNASNISLLQSSVSSNANNIASNTSLANSLATSLSSSLSSGISSNASAILNNTTSINTATNQLQNEINKINSLSTAERNLIDYTQPLDSYTTPGTYYGTGTNPGSWLGIPAWISNWDIILKVDTYDSNIIQTVYAEHQTYLRSNLRTWLNNQFVNAWHDWSVLSGVMVLNAESIDIHSLPNGEYALVGDPNNYGFPFTRFGSWFNYLKVEGTTDVWQQEIKILTCMSAFRDIAYQYYTHVKGWGPWMQPTLYQM